MSDTFRIPECNIAPLQEKLDKLVRKAERLGLIPPALEMGAYEDIPLVEDHSSDCGWYLREQPNAAPEKIRGYRRYYQVTLRGEAPVIPGHDLVAVIEHTNESDIGNVIRAVPGRSCPPVYRQAAPYCCHCGTTRRRLETFILLRVADGEHLQVGRNCLADFVRSPEMAAQLCAYAEAIASLRGFCSGAEDEEFFGGGARHVERVGTEALLAMTARIIRHAGWLPRSKATERQTPTANIVTAIFFDRNFWKPANRESTETRELRQAARSVEDQDRLLAEQTLVWIRGLRPEAETLSDYLYNLLVVLSEETVERKHLGIACSGIASYLRQQEREAADRLDKARPPSEPFGDKGKRGRWQAVFAGYKVFQGSSYGGRYDTEARYLYRFLVDGHKVAVWWTGTELGELKAGDNVVLIGTVKKHDAYNGVAQTTLTRCDVYPESDWGRCPSCSAVVVRADLGKNCPSCRKRGLKMSEQLFSQLAAS